MGSLGLEARYPEGFRAKGYECHGPDSCPASSSLGRVSDSSAMSSLGGVEGGWSHHAYRDTRLIGSVFVCRLEVLMLFVDSKFRH